MVSFQVEVHILLAVAGVEDHQAIMVVQGRGNDYSEGKILGAQAIGGEGVDKRIDVLAVAIQAGMTVFDLEEMELAYAPQFGSAKDPINMAGFVAAGMLRGDHPQIERRADNVIVVEIEFLQVGTGHSLFALGEGKPGGRSCAGAVNAAASVCATGPGIWPNKSRNAFSCCCIFCSSCGTCEVAA